MPNAEPKPTQLGKVEVKGRGKNGGDRPRDPPDWLEIYKKRIREEARPFA